MVDAQVSINLFDAIVLGVVVLLGLLSMFRGFIREVLSLLAWVGAAMITLHSVEGVTNFLMPYVNEKKFVATIFATLGTYFCSLVTISMFSSLILRYVRQGEDVGVADNALGLVFGVFKGWMLVALGFFIMTLVLKKEEYPEWVKTAYILPAVESSAGMLARTLPAYLKEDISSLQEAQKGESVADSMDKDPIGETIESIESGEITETMPNVLGAPDYSKQDTEQLEEILRDTP